ncbi:hypothetical protein [Brachybacterium sp. FME24]|uniref:hypothetical protein n=1 Tax=Brachybacterium sp. FME24 TaxID=2742605 RepID=UPI001D0339EC|nr:hypothetical protein [Brachybacterium sp. FME24]
MTGPDTPSPATSARGRTPLRAWLRPALLLGGGLLVTVVLVLADQLIGAGAVLLFSLFMAYWTSPLHAGLHTPLATALDRRGDDVVIVLWAPGSPLSARLQTAIRSPREDVVWVNVYQDPAAQQFLAGHGGADAVPLVIVGEDTAPAATAVQLLDMQAAGKARAAQQD